MTMYLTTVEYKDRNGFPKIARERIEADDADVAAAHAKRLVRKEKKGATNVVATDVRYSQVV